MKQTLERLEKKLNPGEGVKKAGKALTWSFQKKEVNEILERQKTVALQNDHMYVFLVIILGELFEAIQYNVKYIHQQVTELRRGQKTYYRNAVMC